VPRSRPARDTLLVLLLSALYAAVAFSIHVRWYPIGDLGVESDFYSELAVSARRLAAGDFSVANYPFKGPLYSIVLTAVHAVAGPLGADWYRSAVLLNALAAAGALTVTYRLLRALFGVALAAVVTLALAGTSEVFLHAHKASSDLLFLLLQTAATAALLQAGGRRGLLGAGALVGASFLTRYSGAVLLPAGLALAAWLPDGAMGAAVRLKRAGLVLAGFLLVATPWFALNLAQTGVPLRTGNITNVVQDFYAGERRAEIPAGGFTGLGDLVAHDPVHFVTHLAGNVPRHAAMDMRELVGPRLWPLTALGALGLAAAAVSGRGRAWARRRRPDRRQGGYLLTALLTFLSLCLVFHRVRFSFPLAAPYFVLGYGFLLGLRGRPGRKELLATAAVAAAVAVVQWGTIVRGERFYRDRLPREVLAQAPAVREAAARVDARSLMARKPHLAHYAGLDHAAYPGDPGTLTELLAEARKRGADLIAVGPWELESFPQADYLPWLDRAAGVTRVADVGDVRLFRLDRSLTPEQAAALPGEEPLRARIARARVAADWPAFAAAHAELARLRIPAARWSEAAADLASALEELAAHPQAVARSDHDDLALSLAFCRLGQRRYTDGVALLGEDLSALGPAPSEEWQAVRHTVLARLLAGEGRSDAARRHFSAALDLHRRAGRKEAAAEMAAALAALRDGSVNAAE